MRVGECAIRMAHRHPQHASALMGMAEAQLTLALNERPGHAVATQLLGELEAMKMV